jgi:hypothetical protein
VRILPFAVFSQISSAASRFYSIAIERSLHKVGRLKVMVVILVFSARLTPPGEKSDRILLARNQQPVFRIREPG